MRAGRRKQPQKCLHWRKTCTVTRSVGEVAVKSPRKVLVNICVVWETWCHQLLCLPGGENSHQHRPGKYVLFKSSKFSNHFAPSFSTRYLLLWKLWCIDNYWGNSLRLLSRNLPWWQRCVQFLSKTACKLCHQLTSTGSPLCNVWDPVVFLFPGW